ncbi:MAG TPA: TFIIB-type zinc ribbon-containing protein [Candidatus Nitrosotalea sp.]|nr:TFIIB-type zinc ribbon-containing protein [Candidatus Nitrosotalea sp.]
MVKTTKTKQILYEDPVGSGRLAGVEGIDGAYPKCPNGECKNAPVITDASSGEIICGSCGFVMVERSVDPSPEHVSDATEFITKTRNGPEQSLTMYDMGMMTVISDKDAMGRSLSGDMKSTFGRLKVLNSRSRMASSNRTLRSALFLLYSLKTKLALPDSVAENAAYFYRKAMQKRITIGRSAKGIMSASVYLACRQNDVPRSLVDISQAAGVSRKEVSRAYRNLIEKLEVSIDPCNPSEFVTKIAHEAKISEKTQRDALKILLRLCQQGTSAGKNPMALAAATLYLACVLNGERKTQSEIAKASGVTAVTIRNRCAALKKEIQFHTNQENATNAA